MYVGEICLCVSARQHSPERTDPFCGLSAASASQSPAACTCAARRRTRPRPRPLGPRDAERNPELQRWAPRSTGTGAIAIETVRPDRALAAEQDALVTRGHRCGGSKTLRPKGGDTHWAPISLTSYSEANACDLRPARTWTRRPTLPPRAQPVAERDDGPLVAGRPAQCRVHWQDTRRLVSLRSRRRMGNHCDSAVRSDVATDVR